MILLFKSALVFTANVLISIKIFLITSLVKKQKVRKTLSKNTFTHSHNYPMFYRKLTLYFIQMPDNRAL